MSKLSGTKSVVEVLVEKGLYETPEKAAAAIDQLKIIVNGEILQRDSKAASAYSFTLMNGTAYKIGVIKDKRKTATYFDYKF